MDRILVNTAPLIEQRFFIDGALTDPDGQAVTVTIRHATTGATISTGSATRASTGVYRFQFPAQPALLRTITTWDAAFGGNNLDVTTEQEVVGGFYFTIAELQAMSGCGNITDADAAEIRNAVEDLIEDFTEQAWVPRYRREVSDGRDSCYTGSKASIHYVDRLPARELLTVAITDVDQDLTGWTLSEGGRINSGGVAFVGATAGQNVVVEYVHGASSPPADLKRAALRLARHIALTETTAIPDRAHMMTTEFATFQLTIASENNPTGLPEVDATLRRYRTETPVFA